jgi:hypothetical protein
MKTHQANGFGLLLLLLLSLVQPGAAQVPAAKSEGRNALWQIHGPSNTVYLLGSIHLLKESDYPLAAAIESAFTNSQLAVFETDVGEMMQLGVQMKLLGKARLPDGETLKDLLSAPTYAQFLEHTKRLELPEPMFAQFKPSMAAIMLTMLEIQKLGFNPAFGVDKHLFERARDAGKETGALETVEFQINLVTGFTKEEGELLMKTTLKDLDNTRRMLDDIVKAWRTGNGGALEKLINEALHEAPIIAKRMLTDRNRDWVPKIRELVNGRKTAIVIVGAGHLVGREGVVELLRIEGFKVTQL